MKKIVFATNNAHKLQEMRQIIGDKFQILSLADIDCHDEIPETGKTFAENALQKARYIHQKYGMPCFADDSGLVVDALDGAPGVYSARYAARELGLPQADSYANLQLLLQRMQGIEHRDAHFSTVVALIINGQEHCFEGRVDGDITLVPAGEGGFGYDPIFMPKGWDLTFAQAQPEKKNAISHRGIATKKLIAYLHTLND